MSAKAQVERAAAQIVAAFGSHDAAGYFACFSPNATFLFHNSPRLLTSRAEYENEWASWEKDGFQVLSCESSNGRVDLATEDVAIFTHTVRTKLASEAEPVETGERETIVFVREGGNWLGIHEHLSVDPTYA